MAKSQYPGRPKAMKPTCIEEVIEDLELRLTTAKRRILMLEDQRQSARNIIKKQTIEINRITKLLDSGVSVTRYTR